MNLHLSFFQRTIKPNNINKNTINRKKSETKMIMSDKTNKYATSLSVLQIIRASKKCFQIPKVVKEGNERLDNRSQNAANKNSSFA